MSWLGDLIRAVAHRPHLPDLLDDSEFVGRAREAKQKKISAAANLRRTVTEALEIMDRRRA